MSQENAKLEEPLEQKDRDKPDKKWQKNLREDAINKNEIQQ